VDDLDYVRLSTAVGRLFHWIVANEQFHANGRLLDNELPAVLLMLLVNENRKEVKKQ